MQQVGDVGQPCSRLKASPRAMRRTSARSASVRAATTQLAADRAIDRAGSRAFMHGWW
jgi:hypothetical protein